MADILSGTSDHNSFAPLSGGQSIQLARHLNDQIRNLEDIVGGLKGDLQKTNENVGGVQRSLLVTEASVNSMQEQHRKQADLFEKARQDIARLDKRSRQLQTGQEQINEAVMPMKEQQQLMSTHFDVFKRQMGQAEEKIKDLEEGLERNFKMDKSDRGHTEEQLNRFWERYSRTVATVEQQREGFRNLDAGSREMKHDIERAFAYAQSLEEKATEAARTMGNMARQLEDTSTRSQKLLEDHENTKAQLSEDKSNLKGLNSQVEKMGESLNKANAGLSNANHQLAQAKKALDDQRDKMRRAEHELDRLNSGHMQSNNSLRSLAVSLEETSNLAYQVKKDLKETNSMVLPNIAMDTSSAGMLGTTSFSDYANSMNNGGGLRLTSGDWRTRPTSKTSRLKSSQTTTTPRIRPADMGGRTADMTMLPTAMQSATAGNDDTSGAAPTADATGQVASAWGGVY